MCSVSVVVNSLHLAPAHRTGSNFSRASDGLAISNTPLSDTCNHVSCKGPSLSHITRELAALNLAIDTRHTSKQVQAAVVKAARALAHGAYEVKADGTPIRMSDKESAMLTTVAQRSSDTVDMFVNVLAADHPASIDAKSSNLTSRGAFAARALKNNQFIGFYGRASVVYKEQEEGYGWDRWATLSDYECMAMLRAGEAKHTIVFDGNPLVNPSAMINDPMGTGANANCRLQPVLIVPPNKNAHEAVFEIAVVTTRQVRKGEELLMRYGTRTYWEHRKSHLQHRAKLMNTLPQATTDVNNNKPSKPTTVIPKGATIVVRAPPEECTSKRFVFRISSSPVKMWIIRVKEGCTRRSSPYSVKGNWFYVTRGTHLVDKLSGSAVNHSLDVDKEDHVVTFDQGAVLHVFKPKEKVLFTTRLVEQIKAQMM